jgi:hypothetical protein
LYYGTKKNGAQYFFRVDTSTETVHCEDMETVGKQMARDTFTNGDTAPEGKRTVRRRGDNMIGYIGRTPWEMITGRGLDVYDAHAQKAAKAWIDGRSDWYDAAWQ